MYDCSLTLWGGGCSFQTMCISWIFQISNHQLCGGWHVLMNVLTTFLMTQKNCLILKNMFCFFVVFLIKLFQIEHLVASSGAYFCVLCWGFFKCMSRQPRSLYFLFIWNNLASSVRPNPLIAWNTGVKVKVLFARCSRCLRLEVDASGGLSCIWTVYARGATYDAPAFSFA